MQPTKMRATSSGTQKIKSKDMEGSKNSSTKLFWHVQVKVSSTIVPS